jgi:hypothetical protein
VPLLVYAGSLGNEFVTWDDGLLITENPIIQGLSLHHLWLAFTSYDPELYIPLTFVSYQINYVIGGLQPFGYHLVNLLLHMGNAIMVGLIVERLFSVTVRSGEPRLSATAGSIAGLLFALHPLHTEAVVWAAARKDVLSAFFFLLVVFCYLQSCVRLSVVEASLRITSLDYPSTSLRTGARDDTRRRWYWLSLTFFFLALLSKVSVLTWPLLIPFLDWIQRGGCHGERSRTMARVLSPSTTLRMTMQRPAIESLKCAAPYFGLSVIFGCIALGGKIANTGFFFEKFLMGCRAVTLLLQKFFWPSGLSALYPFTKPISVFTPELGLSVLFVLFVSAGVLWLAARRGVRLPLFAWGWFLLLLAPSFSTITKGHNELLDIYVTSDRYAYLPSIGALLVAHWLFAQGARSFPKIVNLFVFFLLFIFSILSYKQSLVWKDTLSLFTHVATVQPRSYVAWSNIGTEEVRRGNLSEGLHAYTRALQIRDDATTWYNVGQILRAQGKTDLARQAYERAVESSPLETDARNALRELGNHSM